MNSSSWKNICYLCKSEMPKETCACLNSFFGFQRNTTAIGTHNFNINYPGIHEMFAVCHECYQQKNLKIFDVLKEHYLNENKACKNKGHKDSSRDSTCR